ncbi:MAG: homocysteine S-methyltransferase family protein, partial [Clostridia bacterium]|nr:homocysteine S-methyltransferase family protein [Clostridia bacterium]
MTKEQFKQIIQANILLVSTIYEKSDNLYRCYEDFVSNGSNFLIVPTYLYDTESEKKEAIRQVSNAAGTHAFVCGAITPCIEKLTTSGGTMSFDAYYDQIKQEAKFLYENMAASVIFLFGFDTLADAKCAVYAVKEACDLPLCVLLDFKNDTRLADGFDITAATI